MTELRNPVRLRAVVAGDVDSGTLARQMLPQLPAGGLSAAHLRGRYRLADVTWRLLDSRILAAAVEILDLDVAKPLVTWLSRFDRIRAAAQTTTVDPRHPEVTETVLPPHPVTLAHGGSVIVRIDRREVATIAFRAEVLVKLGETSVVVQLGTIGELVCDVLTVSGTFTLEAWPTPLWKPDPVSLPDVHLEIHPPVVVPLAAGPRAPAAVPG